MLLSTLVGGVTVTPIQKVIQLMNDMLAKGQAEKKEEEVKFTAFQQWCGDQSKNKNNEITAANNRIAELSATIEKSAALIRQLTDRIEELEEDNGRWEKDKKAASAVREMENVDFRATQTDYSESIDALGQAINVLKKQAYDRPQAELLQRAFLQLKNKMMVPTAAKSALAAFLQQAQPSTFVDEMPDQRLSYDAPEANAYEFQSSGIVDMLVKLEDEFKEKRTELEREELNAQHAFEQIFQQLTDNIENADHEIEKKTKLRAETAQAKADAEGERAQTTSDRDEDKRYLSEMTALCAQKKTDFESRQELRAGEITAIEKAIEIMSSGAVSGSGEKHLPTLMQLRASRSAALMQLDSDDLQNPMQARISSFLAERARLTGSALLSRVSQQVAANPFGKVKKMIKDLIVKLMEEATAEVEHKGWCDTELGTNKQTRDRKTEQVNQLNSDIEEMTAKIAQLTQDIEDLTTAVAELDAAMAEATKERLASKEKNEQTIQDAKEAQTAVEQATAVLKEFYAKSAQATALAQQSPADDAPETFDKPYQGQLSEGGSVIDFLEVILSDFARLESQTTGDEASEVEEFKNYMFESQKDKALKENEKEHKSNKKADTENALHMAEEDLKVTQDQLDKAIEYYEKLKPTCVDSGISYEDRVKRREAEIQSLKEALAILSGVDFA